LDEVVAVDGGGDGARGKAAGHELEESHLGRCILQELMFISRQQVGTEYI